MRFTSTAELRAINHKDDDTRNDFHATTICSARGCQTNQISCHFISSANIGVPWREGPASGRPCIGKTLHREVRPMFQTSNFSCVEPNANELITNKELRSLTLGLA